MKSRNFSPVGKMGAGRPMSRGSRPGARLSPKATMKPVKSMVASKMKSPMRKKSAGAVTRPSMAKGGMDPRARMARMRRARA